MAEILGLGCTHRPLMLRRDADWTFMMRTALDDPDMPAAQKDPANWPAELRAELGNDWGTAAAGRAREIYRRHFAEARRALDDIPAGRCRHVRRRPVRKFQGRHHPALRRARL